MAADPLDTLRLALMQEVLPVGLAVVERARKGGAREVLAAFGASPGESIGQLKQEGEPAASQVRDTLDRLQPGLGNPVLKVEVHDVPPEAVVDVGEASAPSASPAGPDPVDQAELQATLARISLRLAELERRLA
jgi:hypothetical protein